MCQNALLLQTHIKHAKGILQSLLGEVADTDKETGPAMSSLTPICISSLRLIFFFLRGYVVFMDPNIIESSGMVFLFSAVTPATI